MDSTAGGEATTDALLMFRLHCAATERDTRWRRRSMASRAGGMALIVIIAEQSLSEPVDQASRRPGSELRKISAQGPGRTQLQHKPPNLLFEACQSFHHRAFLSLSLSLSVCVCVCVCVRPGGEGACVTTLLEMPFGAKR